MRKAILFLSLFISVNVFLLAQGSKTKTAVDSNGYKYEYVIGDPSNARIYTLDNGLKIYISVNKDKPRVQTLIAVRAGAKNDPRETTGLAHYFEHMMFKGTDKFGTIDWEKEKVYIEQIIDLFELRNATDDLAEKDRIYRQIDSISQIASKYAIANEYDKICSMLGASGTNAWTSYEETVYVNEIPSNEMERWLMMERDRFENLVLRLFHTELETVFEEFNMGQDRDGRKVSSRMMVTLFKNHPYGVSVIGKGEHLKNPSMKNILNFKSKYYVPNNIAICLAGDIDPEKTVKLIDKYWGDWKANPNIPEFTYKPEEERSSIDRIDVYGPEQEYVTIAWRTPNEKTKEAKMLYLIARILYNGKAGLIDLNLVKKQKVMSAYASAWAMNDYGVFQLGGYPRADQSLEDVEKLLFVELEKIKKGEFEDWLIEAIINEMKLNRIRSIEGNSIAYSFVRNFIQNRNWEDWVYEIDEYEKIKKDELVKFANEFFKDNYVVIYKRLGTDNDVFRIEKPQITPITINRNAESDYVKMFRNITPGSVEPVFVDYNSLIQKQNLGKVPVNYIKNTTNEIFSLYYIFDIGKKHDKKIPIAVNYMKFLGTKDKTLDELQQELFRLGISFNVSAGDDRVYAYVSGLDKNFEAAVRILEDIFKNIKPDAEVYNEYVNSILKQRKDDKLNKNRILWGAMYNYSVYGEKSPFTDILSESELREIKPEELTSLINNLPGYEHKLFYYGPRELKNVNSVLKKYHKTPKNLQPIPASVEFKEKDYTKPQILFVNYDMVQAMIAVVSKDVVFDASQIAPATMFNEYYGGSMSSVVFQEIREAKSLAYSANVRYRLAVEKNKPNFVTGFLSTQPDKMKEALDALTNLLNELALSEKSFEIARESVLKQIETERIIKDDIFWNYESNLKRGINFDYRSEVYEKVKKYKLNDVKTFFDRHVKGKNYDILILGNKEKIDFELLKKYGEVKELTLEEIFNY